MPLKLLNLNPKNNGAVARPYRNSAVDVTILLFH